MCDFPLAPGVDRYLVRAEIDRTMNGAVAELGERVVRLTYVVEPDHSGDVALFFRVVIPDRDAEPGKLPAATEVIRETIESRVRPHARWGLLAYYSYRSKQEWGRMGDRGWK